MSAGTDWASGGLGTRPSSLRLVRRASRRRQLGADRHRPSQLARLEALTETGKLAEDGEMSGRSEDKRCSGDIVVTRPEQCRMRTSRQDGSVDRRMRGSDRAGQRPCARAGQVPRAGGNACQDQAATPGGWHCALAPRRAARGRRSDDVARCATNSIRRGGEWQEQQSAGSQIVAVFPRSSNTIRAR